MTAAARILDRLQRVKQSRPNSWMSACPCCESRKGRPLAITEAQDRRVLLHAFCGCETAAVLQRIGLELGDLFDQPLVSEAMPVVKPTHARPSAGDVLNALTHEANLLAQIAGEFLESRTVSEEDWKRLSTAVQRINHAADYIYERTR